LGESNESDHKVDVT